MSMKPFNSLLLTSSFLYFLAFIFPLTSSSPLEAASEKANKLEGLETLMSKNYASSVLFSYFKLTKIMPSKPLLKPARKVAFTVIKKKGGLKEFLKASQCHITVEEGASTFAYLKRIDTCLDSYIGKKPKEAKPHQEKFQKAINEALREVNQYFLKGPL